MKRIAEKHPGDFRDFYAQKFPVSATNFLQHGAENTVFYVVQDTDEAETGCILVEYQGNTGCIWALHADDEASLVLLFAYAELFCQERGAVRLACCTLGKRVCALPESLEPLLSPYFPGKDVPLLSPTETVNPRSAQLDRVPILEALEIINREDQTVAAAVSKELPLIADFIAALVERMRKGGRLFYTGAGTSGRLGVLDAAECPPTFNTAPDLVVGLIAGGDRALRHPVEGAEDDAAAGQADLERHNLSSLDTLLGIAASGNTPYVCGALRYAQERGALTAALSSNPRGKILELGQYPIAVATGAEVLTGSTRLKSGTMQKLVLNMISTITMVHLGKVYQNLMVDVQASNQKLLQRAHYLVQKGLGCSYDDAHELLVAGNMSVKLALVMGLHSLGPREAEKFLQESGGKIVAEEGN